MCVCVLRFGLSLNIEAQRPAHTQTHLYTYTTHIHSSCKAAKTEISLGNDASQCVRGAPFCARIAIFQRKED